MKKLWVSGVVGFLAMAGHATAETGWEYREVADNFTDETHHIASIKNLPPFASDEFKASFECRNGKEFVFALYTGKNLGYRNGPLKVQYRVNDKRSKTIRMRIFTNSEMGGLNKANAIDIANDILNAKRFRVRAYASNGDQYDSEFSLENARQSVLKAVEACGLYVRDQD